MKLKIVDFVIFIVILGSACLLMVIYICVILHEYFKRLNFSSYGAEMSLLQK